MSSPNKPNNTSVSQHVLFGTQSKIDILAAATAQSVAEKKQCDKMHANSWKHFTTFIALKYTSLELPNEDKYLTRQN
eukprot:14220533-Ditylum_brightwellii.AAC.1